MSKERKKAARQNALVSLFLEMSFVEAFANAYATAVAEVIGGEAGKALMKAAKAGGPTSAKIDGLFQYGFNNKALNKDDLRWKEYDRLRDIHEQYDRRFSQRSNNDEGNGELDRAERVDGTNPAWVLKTLCGLVAFVGEGMPAGTY